MQQEQGLLSTYSLARVVAGKGLSNSKVDWNPWVPKDSRALIEFRLQPVQSPLFKSGMLSFGPLVWVHIQVWQVSRLAML